VTPFSTLGLRLRGGYATADAPLQKQFSIGGIGSVRSYPQNGFAGTRTLIGNAEYIVDDVALFDDAFDDLTLIGFVDAGWVGDADARFAMDDVLPSAGFGIGFDDRTFRIDVSWPLRNLGGDMGPSVWLRISPSF
jgi:hemolysin activation/secretion protein